MVARRKSAFQAALLGLALSSSGSAVAPTIFEFFPDNLTFDISKDNVDGAMPVLERIKEYPGTVDILGDGNVRIKYDLYSSQDVGQLMADLPYSSSESKKELKRFSRALNEKVYWSKVDNGGLTIPVSAENDPYRMRKTLDFLLREDINDRLGDYSEDYPINLTGVYTEGVLIETKNDRSDLSNVMNLVGDNLGVFGDPLWRDIKEAKKQILDSYHNFWMDNLEGELERHAYAYMNRNPGTLSYPNYNELTSFFVGEGLDMSLEGRLEFKPDFELLRRKATASRLIDLAKSVDNLSTALEKDNIGYGAEEAGKSIGRRVIITYPDGDYTSLNKAYQSAENARKLYPEVAITILPLPYRFPGATSENGTLKQAGLEGTLSYSNAGYTNNVLVFDGETPVYQTSVSSTLENPNELIPYLTTQQSYKEVQP